MVLLARQAELQAGRVPNWLLGGRGQSQSHPPRPRRVRRAFDFDLWGDGSWVQGTNATVATARCVALKPFGWVSVTYHDLCLTWRDLRPGPRFGPCGYVKWPAPRSGQLAQEPQLCASRQICRALPRGRSWQIVSARRQPIFKSSTRAAISRVSADTAGSILLTLLPCRLCPAISLVPEPSSTWGMAL